MTFRPLAFVSLHKLMALFPPVTLHALAPTYRALTNPPYALIPTELPLPPLKAWQLEQLASLMVTFKPLASVGSHVLMVSNSATQ
jgi:hypothetical protein